MKFASKIILFIFAIGVFMASCEKRECNELVPELSYNDFSLSAADSVSYLLILDFSDCDGDVGMETIDSVRDENGVLQGFNWFIDVYHMENGIWIKHVYDEDEVGFDYKLPILQNSNQNPTLEGELERKINPVFFSFEGYDTVMFRSRILDNAGHYSNEIETPAFVFTP